MDTRADPVHRALARFLREHAVRRDARVLAAVSGGADSVALLHALLALGQRVAVAHVHHGLRGSAADADLAFVAELARALGAPFRTAHVAAGERDGRSPEARARALRYEALERLRVELDCAHLATAHHADDQAETVLLRAIRGTGLDGLAGIRPSLDEGRVLRPLLALRRAELRAYLDRRGLASREDASNADLAVPRNRLRHEVLPVLEAIHPRAAERLAALAELARAARSSDGVALEPGDGGVWIDASELARLGASDRARAWLELAARAGLEASLSRAHLERLDAFVAAARTGQTLSLPRGHVLFRDRARLWLGPAPGPCFPAPVRVPVPAAGGLEFPERGLRLYWGVEPDPSPGLYRFRARPSDDLVARSPLPADCIELKGRSRRLKELFASARWSRREQARALVVERDGEIVWVPGLWRRAGEERSAQRAVLRAEALSRPAENC